MTTVPWAPTKGDHMTQSLHRDARRHRGREARLVTAGVLAFGAVLLPTASAFAEDTPPMTNGMLCPHALGDASNPATTAPPTRSAPNEAPLGAKPAAAGPTSSPGRAGTTPASKAPAERAAPSRPASTSTTTHANAGAGAVVRATQPQRALTAVPQPQTQRAATPIAQRRAVVAPSAKPRQRSPARAAKAKHATAARHAQAPRVMTTVIPDVTQPSSGGAPQVTSTPAGTQPGVVGWPAIAGMLGLIACAALALVRWRRGRGAALGAVASGPFEPVSRPEPTVADEVEIELQELLAEARASELLGNGEAGEAVRPVTR